MPVAAKVLEEDAMEMLNRFALFFFLVCLFSCSKQEDYTIHTVQEGEFLRTIAEEYPGVSWEDILLSNEEMLSGQYDEFCSRFGPDVRNDPDRRAVWCNDLYNRPYGNLIFPGNELRIPISPTPSSVGNAVDVAGDRIAIVIDDTGSMQDDHRLVATWYSQAARREGKEVVGVYLYADGQIRKYDEGGIQFLQVGNFENTHSALREAMQDTNPDTIVLISDEPGDDWDWGQVEDLPPVIAHCIVGPTGEGCEQNLGRVADETGGEYVTVN